MTPTKGRQDNWQEATRAEPCPVCQHDSWCRVSPDGKWAMCRRVADGAQETTTYSDGSPVYRHLLRDDPPKASGNGRNHPEPEPSNDATPAAADTDTLDRAYRLWLDSLDLAPDHRDNLRARGLTDKQIDAGGYRTWRPSGTDATIAAMRISYALGNDVARTIPGYWQSQIHAAHGLLIPVRDLQGRIVAIKVRRDGKDIEPRYLYVSSKKHGGPGSGSPAHVPLGIMGACPVVRITEGELKADVAWAMSGVPTLSFPGVASWRLVLPVLQALGCKTVRVAFDADAGSNTNVARALRDSVKELPSFGYVVELERWRLEQGKGIDDLLAAGGTPEVLTGPDAMRAVEGIATAAGVTDAAEKPANAKPEPEPSPWVPFPTDALPEPVRGFVVDAANALGCDTAYIALPVLAMLAAAVGNARRVEIKGSWCEPCVLWTIAIGRSGTMKSPAWELATRPLQRLQNSAFRDYKAAQEQHENDRLQYEADLARWKKSKTGSPPPTRPDEPQAVRYIASDATVEALAVLLQDSPRGILLSRDELSGWLSSFDAYKAAHGADVPHWLSMHRAGNLVVDRKTGRRIIHVPRAAVSVTGTVQAGILAKALGGRYEGDEGSGEHFENGLAARLLMAHPPTRPKRWTDADLPDAVLQRLERLVEDLLALPMPTDDDGEPVPVDVHLRSDARRKFIAFYDAHAKEQTEIESDNLAAAWSKLEGYAARIALLCHLIRRTTGDTASDSIELQDMDAGITLSRWFGDEAARIYAEIGGGIDTARATREQNRLIEWMAGRGGQCTPRELAGSGPRRFRGPVEDAERRLQELVDAGKAERFTPPHDGPGRPSGVVFRLLGMMVETETEPHEPREKPNFVSVSTPQTSENEWGEV